jgi:outer membrane protein assembly factor BamB
VQYPGGLRARYRWSGSGGGPAIFALTETGGRLDDYGALALAEPDRACRAELRVEGPAGTWTARFASTIFDEPQGTYWDTAGLLVVKYGFGVYAMAGRSGDLAWSRKSATPVLTVIGSSLLDHVIVQSEVETVAVDRSGEPVWRIAHSDVVVGAEIVGGRLVLTSFGGEHQVLDPRTGRAA